MPGRKGVGKDLVYLPLTFREYFEYLGYSFIIAIIFYIDISKRNIKPKKQKKVYPIDQIIASLIENMDSKEIPISQKIEMITLDTY